MASPFPLQLGEFMALDMIKTYYESLEINESFFRPIREELNERGHMLNNMPNENAGAYIYVN